MEDEQQELSPVSDHRAWLQAARGYLYAANAIRESREYDQEMFPPALHLTGHGIELLLKASLIGSCVSIEGVEKFRHNIIGMWRDNRGKNIGDYPLDASMSLGHIGDNRGCRHVVRKAHRQPVLRPLPE
ncbi:hypothetical protein [Ancylobacter amanitiformis]|uniref:HEPN domain-containing protein n=1 Tax=Ancylobacter amanitiformis TaxID=217069 RepID=A0ABU0LQI5_9HYPH|nr:hypothetical protein [Ancylobacter amanitiformis]MDQ0510964.1 hypothetical protein [Ancylobacter amanitiformis]